MPKPVAYPADPDQPASDYGRVGTELRDPSMKEVGDYYARLASWYTKGGFRDEYGDWHASNHHYKFDYWEVLNEVADEHNRTPERYTAFYDVVVEAVRKVSPQTKFVGLALSRPTLSLPDVAHWFEYFLNPQNHKPSIPVDMISYHYYAHSDPDEGLEACQSRYFEQADHFLDIVHFVEAIRQHLSPGTGTTLDEIGAHYPYADRQPPADSFWNLSAAFYAYMYANLARLGIDGARESTLWTGPYLNEASFVSLLDWKTWRRNARYWVLKLLSDNFSPGDELVETQVNLPEVYAQGFETRDGKRKVLLINKREGTFEVSLPGVRGGTLGGRG